MTSSSKRILVLSGALLCGLLVLTWVLGRGPSAAKPAADGEAERKSLTAIKKGTRPPQPVAPPVPAAVEANAVNLLGRKAMLVVTPEQIDRALDRRGRPLEELIAAQAVLGDHRYLREAAESHPDDPRLQFWILANRVLPDERREWLQSFKEADPDNALANYLAAEEAFRSNDVDAGLAELRAAAAKGYRDYSDDLRGEVAELYSATEQFDPDLVRYASASVSTAPHVEQVQALAERLIQYQQSLVAEGHDEAAAEVAALGLEMVETVAGGSALDAIGSRTMMLFMQEKLLGAAGDSEENLALLSAERERIAGLGESLRTIFATEGLLDTRQLDGYAERLHTEGEVRAAEWLVEQVGDPTPEVE